MTEFDRKVYYQLKKWWDDNGNPDISIWDDEFGYIIFEDKPTRRLVAMVVHLGPKGWAFERYWLSYPITKAEREHIDKFVKCCNDRQFGREITMRTTIYTTDGDCISTPAPCETVRSLLLDKKRPYLEVPGYQGNSYLIQVSHITCIEEVSNAD